jgi:hypothetical protein
VKSRATELNSSTTWKPRGYHLSVRTVVVVGAGGSLAQAQGYRPAMTGLHPPLDVDFFNRTRRLTESNPVIDQALNTLRIAIDRSGRFTYPWDPVVVPMEQFFADVYFEVTNDARTTHLNVYRALLALYVRVLAETTNWMMLRGPGQLDRLIRSEVRRAGSDELTVITFNQDLVLESVAARMPRQWGRWCLRGLYGDFPLNQLLNEVPAGTEFPHHTATCVHQRPFKLLKLHGSLNWATRSSNSEMTRRRLFPGPDATVNVLNGRTVEIAPVVTGSGRRGRHTWYLSQLVVPPIYDKQQVTGMNVLQQIWQAAREAVASAERLILIGYSLPDGDVGGKQMLRRAFTENAPLECVECVNPDATMAAKLQSVLGARAVRIYDSVPTFLRYEGAA